MIYVRVSPDNPELSSIEEVGKILAMGGFAIFPTDTVYGLGCDVLNEKSVKRIYELKKRENKPLPILLSSHEVADKIALMSETAKLLARRFWPGPLTLKVYPKIKLSIYFLDDEGKIAVRIPDHPVPRMLSNYINGMIVGTSANISGMTPPVTAEDALKQIMGVDAVIDAGPSRLGKPSTIVDVAEKEIKLVREGSIPFSIIEGELKVG
ncbi:MAG: threonylcarbamoyl-AMP synthase [Desulfurococcales archaeon]|jgi:L-threonylcarbamoyladenylate synthase|nr:threonylcarbamoyl-AMP synthase [Desulfurococcales archaeon]